MHIGSISLANNLFVAPMAGVTDRPFRTLCKQLGAGYAVSEIVTSKKELWNSLETSRRADHTGESGPIAVQITGTSPQEMAEAANYNIGRGAQIIDINMGCPAKKVCQKWAGSALMQNETLALQIIEAVVNACHPHHVPVTLKMRTGWCNQVRNAASLAKKAQDAGIAMLTIHGRTREQGYSGQAEYDTIAQVKSQVNIPVVANGDIDSPAKAKYVLEKTGANALMIGRAAQGRPWIFQEIAHFLNTGELRAPPTVQNVKKWIISHLHEHYSLYGEESGVKSARKHIGWLAHPLPGGQVLRQHFNRLESADAQLETLENYLDELAQTSPQWPDAGSNMIFSRHQASPSENRFETIDPKVAA